MNAAARAVRDDLCHGCRGAAPEPGRTRCAPCLERRRADEERLRKYRRRNRLCLTCGRGAAPQRRYCAAHLAYYVARDRRRRKAGV